MSAPTSRPSRPNDRRGFGVAIFCALPIEADAIKTLFDHRWDHDGSSFGRAAGDANAYSVGTIGSHNVVLVHMPGMGKVQAATAASSCRISFPMVKIALVVGICGVAPLKRTGEEIILGDVIISEGIIQSDFGRRLPDGFVPKEGLLDTLGRPSQEIRGVLTQAKGSTGRQLLMSEMTSYLNVLRQHPELRAEYPSSSQDRLFEASYRHDRDQQSCDQLCCDGKIVPRSRLRVIGPNPVPEIHFGLIACSDSVMKYGEERDRQVKESNVIAFEMEGAGVWDTLPCIVVKGACDYADSHKSKIWQQYAAATAAACAKALLRLWVSSPDQDASNMDTHSQNTTLPSNIQDSSDPSHPSRIKAECQAKPRFLVPFSENDLFTGRDGVLAKLQTLLFDQGRRKVALVGLGGIGKTQIALQMAYWTKETKQDYSVFWAPALSRASFEQACVQIIDACKIPNTNDEDAIEIVRRYLSSEAAGKWLLIVDNADDIETVMGSTNAEKGIYRSLPQSSQGRILFTTRYRKVAVSVAGRNIVDVHAMSQDEATSYLKDALIDGISPSDEQATHRLLELLTYLPLAITQTAAYVNQNQIPLASYLQLFENTDRDKLELLSTEFQDDTRYEQSQDPVAATWFISFNQIRKDDELALRILKFLSYVEPKAIPRSMLPEGESQQELTRAIGTLCGYKFLDRRGSSELFDMHSLVHLAIKLWVAESDSEKEQKQAAIVRLEEVFPTHDWENRELWRQYMPHVIKILRSADDTWSEELSDLVNWAGLCLLVDGRVAEAVAMFERLVAAQEIILPNNRPSRLASKYQLASAYKVNGQIKEAIELLEHVVSVEEIILPSNHPDQLSSQHQLASAYLDNGQIKEATELLERLVAAQEIILPNNHPSRLASKHQLASAYLVNGQIKEAIELLEHVVSVKEIILPNNHPSRLASQHQLASAYLDNEQIKEAIELLEHVVTIKQALAETHPSRLASQHELASAYRANEQIREAITLLEHVVTINQKLAETHPKRLASQHELASAYLDNEQIKEAIALHEHVVTIRQTLAETHPKRLVSQHQLAIAYHANGQFKEAIALLEHVVTIKQTLAETHPDRLASQYQLARAYQANGRPEEAIVLLEHVVTIEAEILPEDSQRRQVSRRMLQIFYEELERARSTVEAETSF
ncbi:ankyrin protein 3 [Fusarium heterosporum]|uniref:Ankyrin protein 3 n=1 Tax=Fusarium heterosporum TaxID=42747 RepID=A0A8H5TMM9_FUSHE|nr:ankyrin protein 3 [Fusarium heterosporum]